MASSSGRATAPPAPRSTARRDRGRPSPFIVRVLAGQPWSFAPERGALDDGGDERRQAVVVLAEGGLERVDGAPVARLDGAAQRVRQHLAGEGAAEARAVGAG